MMPPTCYQFRGAASAPMLPEATAYNVHGSTIYVQRYVYIQYMYYFCPCITSHPSAKEIEKMSKRNYKKLSFTYVYAYIQGFITFMYIFFHSAKMFRFFNASFGNLDLISPALDVYGSMHESTTVAAMPRTSKSSLSYPLMWVSVRR